MTRRNVFQWMLALVVGVFGFKDIAISGPRVKKAMRGILIDGPGKGATFDLREDRSPWAVYTECDESRGIGNPRYYRYHRYEAVEGSREKVDGGETEHYEFRHIGVDEWRKMPTWVSKARPDVMLDEKNEDYKPTPEKNPLPLAS